MTGQVPSQFLHTFTDCMQQRVIGFDLARAYALLGMFIVNFNFSFGSIMAPDGWMGRFLNVFTGNSTAIFIICAGMGVSLMRNVIAMDSPAKKVQLKSKVLKRSWFLFFLGFLLYNWWPGDILHFYGGYMHIAAFLLFVPGYYYVVAAVLAIIVFHGLLFIIPVETGWDFTTFLYTDFWSVGGFLRNTLYNGWNALFPWLAYFLTGMWLGRLNWTNPAKRRNVFVTGLIIFSVFQALRFVAKQAMFDSFWTDYIMAEYFPPYLPFMMLTLGFALMVIPAFMYLGDRFAKNAFVLALQQTGQMTLSHYVIHLTLGMLLLGLLTGKQYSGLLEDETPTPPLYIFIYAVVFYTFSILFSVIWRKKFRLGPLEALMRKFSG